MANYQATNACTWRDGRYIPGTTQDIRQGVFEDLGQCVGVMIFNLTSIRNQYQDYYPTSASLALTRTGAGAWGSERTMTLYAGNQTGIPSLSSSTNINAPRPTKVSSAYNYDISAGQGDKVIDISTALIDSIGSGASNCLFIDAGSSTTHYMSFKGRNDLTKIVLTINWESRTTAASAPTSCSLSSTLAEGNVTLSWSGAKSGANNDISAYEIQYSDSTNNSTWGSWTSLTVINSTATSGSLSVSPPNIRGDFRRFRIRTRGMAGSAYYSGWKVSSNTVRKNTLPSAPTTAIASPEIHSNETITLTWSGAAGGTSAIKGYQISSRTSMDNNTWGEWNELISLNLNANSGSYNPLVSNVSGTYTQFSIRTIDVLGAISSEKISNSILCNITACGEPTVFSLSTTVAEGSLTLSWNGATAGAGNAIIGYEIEYSDSSDDSNWGIWSLLKTVMTSGTSGSTSASPSPTRGYYRRFRIRTLGTAGSSYYSDWKTSANSVRKNILPTPPSILTVSPTLYETPTVTINWSGTLPGTSPIKHYVIQRSTSYMGNPPWSSYETLATIVSSETSGTYVSEVSNIPGTSTRYRISVTDTLDAVSAYVTSNIIRKNSPPTAPKIECPISGRTTFNRTPRFMITTGVEPDGQTQIVEVRLNAGQWYSSVDNTEMFSTNGYLGDNTKTVFKAPTLSTGIHTVTIRCLDSDLMTSSTEIVKTFNVQSSPFELIMANVTTVKATHINTLRTTVNTIREFHCMPPIVWGEEIISLKTTIERWPQHIQELRAALEPIITRINEFDGTSTFDIPPVEWIPFGVGRPKADAMIQLHELIQIL